MTAPNRIGIAAWQSGDCVWRIKAHGGRDGIRLLFADQDLALLSSNDQPLPTLQEQFVRGQELHLSYPQQDQGCQFGFRVVIRPIELDSITTDEQLAVFELLISVQTTLLDAHPTIDLVSEVGSGCRVDSVDGIAGAIHSTESAPNQTAVLLGPPDAPFTSEISGGDDALRLRLFGEFMEKGVIRRARPWVIIDREGRPIDTDEAITAWRALAASPVPLT
ncbi:hypothetical protein [Stieleria tagensis]|uniref:hypothetical protein n=1 Tax=Stieleria tagensis TaxID=2956795 RepID=UPI00209AC987|nr:hypothetical protein [Stieleria tagensis]